MSQEVREVPEATRAKAPAVKTTPRVQPGLKRAVSGYDYVRADLKRIGLLSGLMVVIVVVLAFTLG